MIFLYTSFDILTIVRIDIYIRYRLEYIYIYITYDCSDIGYVCMIFHKRDSHIIEIQQSGEYTLAYDIKNRHYAVHAK